jgi:hypothetical protein
MKRFLIVCFLCLAAVAAPAQGVYPESFSGDFIGGSPQEGDFLLKPTMTCYHPWGMVGDDGECAYFVNTHGYLGEILAGTDAIQVTLSGAVNQRGRVFSSSPVGYPAEFEWDEDCSCYLKTELRPGGLLLFDAWVYNAEAGEIWRKTGCFYSTGSYGPWWDISKQCVYQEFLAGPVPEYNTERATGRRK